MVSFVLHLQLHNKKALIFCYIVSFYQLLNRYFRLKEHVSKRQITCHFKNANLFFFLSRKDFRSYKLLIMTTPKKTACTVRTFSFKKSM